MSQKNTWVCPACREVLSAWDMACLVMMVELHKTQHEVRVSYKDLVSLDMLRLTTSDITFLKACGVKP
jgi:hypothetical protein